MSNGEKNTLAKNKNKSRNKKVQNLAVVWFNKENSGTKIKS